MNEYIVIPEKEIGSCSAADVTTNNWNYPYAPKTEARLTYHADKGIVIRLTSYEKEPFTRYTKNYDPVYTDSCMECFFNLCPDKSKYYINFETNSNGAYIISYGEGRHERVHITPTLGLTPDVKITKSAESWTADVVIGNDILKAVYGDFSIKRGHVFLGNFYKCGEDGDNPHFLSWNKLNPDKIDFHVPEYFGKFIVE